MFKILSVSSLAGFCLLSSSVALAAMPKVASTATSTEMALATSTSATTTLVATSTLVLDRAAVEKRVREYFADVPDMIAIARCESNFRQYTDSGLPFRGGAMVGVFQFYETLHASRARSLGFDITTLEGNLGYARKLYSESGTTPWRACAPASVSLTDAQVKLKIELLTKVIELLQQLLVMKLAEK